MCPKKVTWGAHDPWCIWFLQCRSKAIYPRDGDGMKFLVHHHLICCVSHSLWGKCIYIREIRICLVTQIKDACKKELRQSAITEYSRSLHHPILWEDTSEMDKSSRCVEQLVNEALLIYLSVLQSGCMAGIASCWILTLLWNCALHLCCFYTAKIWCITWIMCTSCDFLLTSPPWRRLVETLLNPYVLTIYQLY